MNTGTPSILRLREKKKKKINLDFILLFLSLFFQSLNNIFYFPFSVVLNISNSKRTKDTK